VKPGRKNLIYGLLVVAWLLILGWQAVEHHRVRESARASLAVRGRDITTTLGLVIRSQRRFGSIVSQERIEPALKELIKTEDVESVHLLNVSGEVVASAGPPLESGTKSIKTHAGEYWDERSVTLVNLVDLGTNAVTEGDGGVNRIIVVPRREAGSTNTNDRRGDWGFPWRSPGSGSNTPPPLAPPKEGDVKEVQGPPPSRESRGPSGRQWFGRPPWMNEEEYRTLISKQGLHGFVVVMTTQSVQAVCDQDFWMRMVVAVMGGVAVVGLTLAWRTMVKSSELQLRLLKASEMNNHLKEMNIAAAGLAHETRNPLNIVRGLAQMISKREDATPEIRSRSLEITNEVDRVTVQLNQFINYSKPREVRATAVDLDAVIDEVASALGGDMEEKRVRWSRTSSGLKILADEQMFRQALFNLVMNAIQAVDDSKTIEIVSGRTDSGEAYLEVIDNGPGVPAGNREEIFKPYFTTRADGTGLGLAVVHQIVLAHGWEIQCLPNEPQGARFRINHIKPVTLP
jgi:signal transduction histidine kinase